jgi:predicted nucleic acid-binding protein
MSGYIIDCCSLINLYTGWGGLTELQTVSSPLHVCKAVFNELEYTREYGPDGSPVLVPLDMDALQKIVGFSVSRPKSSVEMEDYVSFAMEIDDGEAQALTIAKHRGFILITDDEKAKKVAALPDVHVTTCSTADVLRGWSTLDPQNEKRLYTVIPRITRLARFRPPVKSMDHDCWARYLGT